MLLYKKIVKGLISRWYLLLILPIIAVAATFLMLKVTTKEYKSMARLQVAIPRNELSFTDEKIQHFQIAPIYQNLIQLLQSQTSLEKVRMKYLIDHFNDKNNFLEYKGMEELGATEIQEVIKDRAYTIYDREITLNLEETLDGRINKLLESNKLSYDDLQKNMSIKHIEGSEMIMVEYTANHPKKAQYVLSLLVDVMKERREEMTLEQLGEKRKRLEKLLEKSAGDLAYKEQELQNIKQDNNLINLEEYTRSVATNIAQLEGDLVEVSESIRMHEKAIAAIGRSIGEQKEVFEELASRNTVVDWMDSLSHLQKLEVYEDAFYSQASYDEREELSRKKEKLMSMIVSASEGAIAQNQSPFKQDLFEEYMKHKLAAQTERGRLPLVRLKLERMKEAARNYAPLEMDMDELEREIEIMKGNYVDLQSKFRKTLMAEEEAHGLDLKEIDRPTYPYESVGKSKELFMIVATGAGMLILAIAIISLLEIIGFYKGEINEFLS
ncbi:GumC family protein [Algivirga pacifica]|uniref:Polysaccharide chain length determinant N-terminal domain-containing protein n=1 Tax=Algivirga pacifica TaxID=1162670 RepID=A0ABP9DDD0_9BACT